MEKDVLKSPICILKTKKFQLGRKKMTFFEIKEISEIKEPGWNYNTLSPPLHLSEILMDFKYQFLTYSKSNLTLKKKLGFIILRVMQRFAYNLGWILITNKYDKSLRRAKND